MDSQNEQFRSLPSVNAVLEGLPAAMLRLPRTLVVAEIRRVIERMRDEIRTGGRSVGSAEQRVTEALAASQQQSLRRVINATGVVLHTNLGRAPLGAMASPAGYLNLEYDLASGARGKRDTHISGLIERLLGAPGIAVNNNAAAVFLALNEFAAGGEAVVSRGELIEIGDGFRIPDIMARSGAVLREVGTTNRTSIDDYRAAIGERTRLLLRVHPSNFRIEGFTSRPAIADLAALGRGRGIPVYEDLGSGCVMDLRMFGIDEPLVKDSLAAGADLVSFSGDKLLGGPQAGILAGRPEMVARLRRNPLFRALRLDKLVLNALEATLRNLLFERWDEIPALAMIRQSPDRIRERSEALLAQVPGLTAKIVQGESAIGGGATPQQPIPTWLISIECASVTESERRLRTGEPPAIARIENDRLILDLRTVFVEEEEDLARLLQGIRSAT